MNWQLYLPVYHFTTLNSGQLGGSWKNFRTYVRKVSDTYPPNFEIVFSPLCCTSNSTFFQRFLLAESAFFIYFSAHPDGGGTGNTSTTLFAHFSKVFVFFFSTHSTINNRKSARKDSSKSFYTRNWICSGKITEVRKMEFIFTTENV